MDKDDFISPAICSLSVCALIFLAMGCLVGCAFAKSLERSDAYNAGVGYYQIDPESGRRCWHWIDINKPPTAESK